MDYQLTEISIVDLFEKQAELHPYQTAVIAENLELNYQSLKNKVDVIASILVDKLKNANVPEPIVIVYLPKSIDLVASILATLKANAGFLILDTTYPLSRIEHCVNDSGANVIISDTPTIATLGNINKTFILVDKLPKITVKSSFTKTKPNQIAYAVYTSGSTGKPKGIIIKHASLMNVLLYFKEKLNLTNTDLWLSVTSPGFDIFILEILAPIISGASCVLYDKGLVFNPQDLKQYMVKIQPTVMQATPSLWSQLANIGLPTISKMTAISGGEKLNTALAEQLNFKFRKLINVYGPCETTIWSTSIDYNGNAKSIGYPIANTSCYILDKNQAVVKKGEVGLLYIGGIGLAREYINLPELTSKYFINHGTSNNRLYCTGDLVQENIAGEIEFISRIDNQVKLNGHRIELEEIEIAILSIPGISEAAVILNTTSSNPNLTLFYVINKPNLEPDFIKSNLSKLLPNYMIPTEYIKLDTLPVNSHGKIDRHYLLNHVKKPSENNNCTTLHNNITSNNIIASIVEIWENVLEISVSDLDAEFILLGGNSIHIPQVLSKINKKFNVRLTIRHFMENQSINKISNKLISLLNESRA